MEQTVAQVYVEKAVYAIDRPYSYAVPEEMQRTLCRGCRVLVPFGGGNRQSQGLVAAVETVERPDGQPLKPVLSQLDQTPLLNEEMFGLIRFLREHTYCTCYEAVKAMLPGGMNVSVSERFVQSRPCTSAEYAALPPAQAQVLRNLSSRVHSRGAQVELFLQKQLSVLEGSALSFAGDAPAGENGAARLFFEEFRAEYIREQA